LPALCVFSPVEQSEMGERASLPALCVFSPVEQSEMGEGDRKAGASATADAVEGASRRTIAPK